jgi:very-short-patch-repair endonuclease
MVKLKGQEDFPFYFGAKPEILKIAWELRKNMTMQEKILWERLSNKKLKGVRFRRQHPVSEFVVDFFCYEAMLAIEVDGDIHKEPYQMERDKERTNSLLRLGIKVIRFSNTEIKNDIEKVIVKINQELRIKGLH